MPDGSTSRRIHGTIAAPWVIVNLNVTQQCRCSRHCVILVDILICLSYLSIQMSPAPWIKFLNRLVGESVQRLRRSHSSKTLTQKGLSDRTGGLLSRSSIASIERGLQGVSIPQLYALAQALEVEPGEILPGRNLVFPTQPGKVADLVKTATPEVASFIRQMQQTAATRKGGTDA